MPAKGRGKKPGDDSDDDSYYNGASLSKFNVKLTGIDNYDDWMRSMSDWTYGRGRACERMFDRGCSMDSEDDPKRDDDDFDTKSRRQFWTIATNSLSKSIRRRWQGSPKAWWNS